MSTFPNCPECFQALPPRGRGLDRLAAYFEGRGAQQPTQLMTRLERVLTEAEVTALPPEVVTFYESPVGYQLVARVTAGLWSRLLLRAVSRLGRQLVSIDRAPAGDAVPVCQWLYVDARGRTHWDRYACIDGRCQRLFVARMEWLPGCVRETFVLYGLPIALTFRARVQAGALVLTLAPRAGSPLSWIARVRYRCELGPDGLTTRGDFRVPLAGFRAQTEFRAVRRSPG